MRSDVNLAGLSMLSTLSCGDVQVWLPLVQMFICFFQITGNVSVARIDVLFKY